MLPVLLKRQKVNFFRFATFRLLLTLFCYLLTLFFFKTGLAHSFFAKTQLLSSGIGAALTASSHVPQVGKVHIGKKEFISLPTPSVVSKNAGWGVARQIDKDTWTMQVGQDGVMATPQEVLAALNNYRLQQGKNVLLWNDALASFANTRAGYFNQLGRLDNHAGFMEFMNKEDGFNKLGFLSLGENSSIGFKLSGVHLIEWVYAGDKPHNDNQLSAQWTHVGIGVVGVATDLVFGGKQK